MERCGRPVWRNHLALIHFSLEKTCFVDRPGAIESCRAPERISRLRAPLGRVGGLLSTHNF